jgi:hypothetical protein
MEVAVYMYVSVYTRQSYLYVIVIVYNLKNTEYIPSDRRERRYIFRIFQIIKYNCFTVYMSRKPFGIPEGAEHLNLASA